MNNKPHTFLWGTSTSAHQVEGNNINDWAAWEPGHAQQASAAAKAVYDSGGSVWEDWDHIADKPEAYISGKACDHYHRFKEDAAILASIGANAFRLSIEWSRIEPEEGVFNQAEINHYREVIQTLKEKGIEPLVTLWHWTIPTWFAKKGGFRNRRAVFFFNRFVEQVASSLGSDVHYWITLNEPEIFTSQGYVIGKRPPQIKNALLYFPVLRTLTQCHNAAFDTLKRANPACSVGLAKDCYHFFPGTPSFINRLAVRLLHSTRNNLIFWMVRRRQDFLGINYYVAHKVSIRLDKPASQWLQDQGWEGSPSGLPALLMSLQRRFNKPLIITENGTIDGRDEHRALYIRTVGTYLKQAMAEGVNLIGYLHWTLLDCFEWDIGYVFRFGLVNVNRETGARTVKASAAAFTEVGKNFTAPIVE
jgi:beta-glucosidase